MLLTSQNSGDSAKDCGFRSLGPPRVGGPLGHIPGRENRGDTSWATTSPSPGFQEQAMDQLQSVWGSGKLLPARLPPQEQPSWRARLPASGHCSVGLEDNCPVVNTPHAGRPSFPKGDKQNCFQQHPSPPQESPPETPVGGDACPAGRGAGTVPPCVFSKANHI